MKIGNNGVGALKSITWINENISIASASFKSAGRQNRAQDSAYAGESKLDAVMRKTPSKISVKDDFDDDTSDAFDDEDTDISVTAVPRTESAEEKIVETDMSYVRRTIAENSSDDIAPYGSMRRRPVRREAAEVNETPETDSVPEEKTPVSNVNEKKNVETKKVPDKAAETIAKANLTISNLKIQKARVTVVAMGMALCCLVLLIILICMGVSNSNLKEEIASLKNNGPSTDYTPNTNGTNVPSTTESPDGSSENNTENNPPSTPSITKPLTPVATVIKALITASSLRSSLEPLTPALGPVIVKLLTATFPAFTNSPAVNTIVSPSLAAAKASSKLAYF